MGDVGNLNKDGMAEPRSHSETLKSVDGANATPPSSQESKSSNPTTSQKPMAEPRCTLISSSEASTQKSPYHSELDDSDLDWDEDERIWTHDEFERKRKRKYKQLKRDQAPKSRTRISLSKPKLSLYRKYATEEGDQVDSKSKPSEPQTSTKHSSDESKISIAKESKKNSKGKGKTKELGLREALKQLGSVKGETSSSDGTKLDLSKLDFLPLDLRIFIGELKAKAKGNEDPELNKAIRELKSRLKQSYKEQILWKSQQISLQVLSRKGTAEERQMFLDQVEALQILIDTSRKEAVDATKKIQDIQISQGKVKPTLVMPELGHKPLNPRFQWADYYLLRQLKHEGSDSDYLYQNWMRLKQFGQATGFDADMYKNGITSFLTTEMQKYYDKEDLGNKSLSEVLTKLAERFITVRSDAARRRDIKNFKREAGERITHAYRRYERLISELEHTVDEEFRKGWKYQQLCEFVKCYTIEPVRVVLRKKEREHRNACKHFSASAYLQIADQEEEAYFDTEEFTPEMLAKSYQFANHASMSFDSADGPDEDQYAAPAVASHRRPQQPKAKPFKHNLEEKAKAFIRANVPPAQHSAKQQSDQAAVRELRKMQDAHRQQFSQNRPSAPVQAPQAPNFVPQAPHFASQTQPNVSQKIPSNRQQTHNVPQYNNSPGNQRRQARNRQNRDVFMRNIENQGYNNVQNPYIGYSPPRPGGQSYTNSFASKGQGRQQYNQGGQSYQGYQNQQIRNVQNPRMGYSPPQPGGQSYTNFRASKGRGRQQFSQGGQDQGYQGPQGYQNYQQGYQQGYQVSKGTKIPKGYTAYPHPNGGLFLMPPNAPAAVVNGDNIQNFFQQMRPNNNNNNQGRKFNKYPGKAYYSDAPPALNNSFHEELQVHPQAIDPFDPATLAQILWQGKKPTYAMVTKGVAKVPRTDVQVPEGPPPVVPHYSAPPMVNQVQIPPQMGPGPMGPPPVLMPIGAPRGAIVQKQILARQTPAPQSESPMVLPAPNVRSPMAAPASHIRSPMVGPAPHYKGSMVNMPKHFKGRLATTPQNRSSVVQTSPNFISKGRPAATPQHWSTVVKTSPPMMNTRATLAPQRESPVVQMPQWINQANLIVKNKDLTSGWMDVKKIKYPAIPNSWTEKQAGEYLWNIANTAVEQLEKADNIIRSLRRNVQRLEGALLDLKPDDRISTLPHIYAPQHFSNKYVDAIVIVTVTGLLPPPVMEWNGTYYYPTALNSQAGEAKYQELIHSPGNPTFDVIRLSPDGQVWKLPKMDPNYITLQKAIEIRERNPELYVHPNKIPTQFIWKSNRDRVLMKNAPDDNNFPQNSHGGVASKQAHVKSATFERNTKQSNVHKQEATAAIHIQQKQPWRPNCSTEQSSAQKAPLKRNASAMVGNQSAFIYDKEQSQQIRGSRKDSEDKAVIFYEQLGKRDSKLPEYLTFRLDPTRELPATRYVKFAACDYRLVGDLNRLNRYRKHYEERLHAKLAKKNPSLQLQQILYHRSKGNDAFGKMQSDNESECMDAEQVQSQPIKSVTLPNKPKRGRPPGKKSKLEKPANVLFAETEDNTRYFPFSFDPQSKPTPCSEQLTASSAMPMFQTPRLTASRDGVPYFNSRSAPTLLDMRMTAHTAVPTRNKKRNTANRRAGPNSNSNSNVNYFMTPTVLEKRLTACTAMPTRNNHRLTASRRKVRQSLSAMPMFPRDQWQHNAYDQGYQGTYTEPYQSQQWSNGYVSPFRMGRALKDIT